jgi:hypothetical protein
MWAHAAMVLSDALWHLGEGEQALAQDREIQVLLLPPEEAVRAACLHAEHLGADERAEASLERLRQVEHLVDELAPRDRAAFLAMRAWCKTRVLDVDGGLQDADEAMRSDPDPETMVRCYLSRTVLLGTRDPVAAYQSAAGCIDLAHQHGLVRFETLAWGLCGPHLVAMGKTREVVDRLRADVARLRGRGEYRMVAMLLITLGEIYRASGQLDEAEAAYAEASTIGARGPASMAPAARVNLAILGVVRRDPARIRAARTDFVGGEGSALRRCWTLLDILAQLLEGGDPSLPDPEDISWGVRLGADGVFLCRVLALLLEERGMPREANAVLGLMLDAATDHQMDVQSADDLVQRFLSFNQPNPVPADHPA